MRKSELLNALNNEFNKTYTTNGARAYKSTNDKVYDFFAFAGATMGNPAECLEYFTEAWYENPDLAIKALFWLRDCRGGSGLRENFRTCFVWLLDNAIDKVMHLIPLIPTFGRWDDVLDILDRQNNRKLERDIYESLIYKQFMSDVNAEHPSLLAKWSFSINTSSLVTRAKAKKAAHYLGLSNKEYRKMLSMLREKIKVVERLMSANDWDAINFSEVPSGANLKYRDTFATREETAQRYAEFIKSDNTSMHSATLFPYKIAKQMVNNRDSLQTKALDKMWDNLPDYFDGNDRNILCVADTSGSMLGDPIYTSISLATYCAQRNKGAFHNVYMTFSENPELIHLREGASTSKQIKTIYNNTINANTDLVKVFDLLMKVILENDIPQEEIPESIVVISDMQIDAATSSWDYRAGNHLWTMETTATEMEQIRARWASYGYRLPNLVYWNVNAIKPTILDKGDSVSFVSGLSPSLFKSVCSGKSGKDLMLDVLMGERYKDIVL